MRMPSLRRRLVGVPILVIAVGAILVYEDVIYARRLEILVGVLMLYIAVEILFANRRGGQT